MAREKKRDDPEKLSRQLHQKYGFQPHDLHNLQSQEKALDGLRINNRVLRQQLADSVLEVRRLRRQVQGAEHEVSVVSKSLTDALADKQDVRNQYRELKKQIGKQN